MTKHTVAVDQLTCSASYLRAKDLLKEKGELQFRLREIDSELRQLQKDFGKDVDQARLNLERESKEKQNFVPL